jgi:Tfp pilus assembly protein FimV
MATESARPVVTTPAPKTRMHLTRRGRVVLTTLAAVPLVIAAACFALNGGGAFASNGYGPAESFSHVTVSSGQSLWQIAERVAPSADPRDVVAAIVDLNQLQTSMLMPGQRLAIPAKYSH